MGSIGKADLARLRNGKLVRVDMGADQEENVAGVIKALIEDGLLLAPGAPERLDWDDGPEFEAGEEDEE